MTAGNGGAAAAADELTTALAAAQTWEDLTERVVCCMSFYEKLAHFLIHSYVIESGEHKGQALASDPAVNYLRIALNLAADLYRITGAQASGDFLVCLSGGSSPQAKWLQGLQDNMQKLAFERAKLSGAKWDNSAGKPRATAAPLSRAAARCDCQGCFVAQRLCTMGKWRP